MTILGNPQDSHQWLPGLIRLDEIMLETLLPAAWPECCAALEGRLEDEPKVTERLVCCLRNHKHGKEFRDRFGQVPFTIEFERSINPCQEIKGRNDFALLDGIGEEECYLAYECKWMGKPDNTGVSEYIGKDGMERFITGKYGGESPAGNMLGYAIVTDTAPITKIEEKLRKALEIRKYPLSGTQQKFAAGILSMGRTRHDRRDLCPISIGHILLPYPNDR